MKNYIKKYKKITLFIFALISLISIILIGINIKKETPNIIKPSSVPLIFKLERIIPNNGIGTNILKTSAIEFDFNKPIDVSSLIINISPNIQFNIETDDKDKILFIKADPFWEPGIIYTFNIQLKSKENEDINPTIIYKLKLENLVNSEMTEQFITPSP